MVDVIWIGWFLLLLAILAPFVIRWVRRIRKRTPVVVIDRRWVGRKARLLMYVYAAAWIVVGLGLLVIRPTVEGGAVELGLVALGVALIGLLFVAISHIASLRADEEGIVAGHAIIPWSEITDLQFSPGLGLKVKTISKIPFMRRWNADPSTCEFSAFAFDLEESKVQKLLSLYRTYAEANPETSRSPA